MVIREEWVPLELSRVGSAGGPGSIPRSSPFLSRRLNQEKVPFAVSFEVAEGNNSGTISRLLAPLGWSARSTYDCSHTGDRHSYTFVQSPEMTLADGGRQRMVQALAAIRPLKLSTGDTGAMRIWVKADRLDAAAYRNLLRIFLAYEAVIYRLAQHGHPKHHGTRRDYKFCIPPSRYAKPDASWMNAGTADAFLSGMQGAAWKKDTYRGRHQGLNLTNSARLGFLEFRYFDSTLDPDAMVASVDLVLGMVKAAYEGNLSDSRRMFPINQGGQPFSWKAFHRFLDETVGDSPSRQVLERLYHESGGKLTRQVTHDDEAWLSGLKRDGYRFELPDGRPLPSLAEAAEKNLLVKVSQPGGQEPYLIRGRDLLLGAPDIDAVPASNPILRVIKHVVKTIFRKG